MTYTIFGVVVLSLMWIALQKGKRWQTLQVWLALLFWLGIALVFILGGDAP